MIPLGEAFDRVIGRAAVLPPLRYSLSGSLGLVLAEDVVAQDWAPPFDNSAMDGFAVISSDLGPEGAELDVVGSVGAGNVANRPIEPGQAVKIMTGAPLPAGADAVVMLEDSRPIEGGRVAFDGPVAAGTAVRRRGDDLEPGDRVLDAGTVIGPSQIGVAAVVGRSELLCVARPRVGVLSTGDELVPVGAALAPGQIRDSNRPTICALVQTWGGEAVDLGWLPDDADVVAERLSEAAANCDLVVTSGGVSMGDHDHVRHVLPEIGEAEWMQVAIKPAKPLVSASVGGTPVVGLPGNPVSVVVSFTLFAGPTIRCLAGRQILEAERRSATLVEPVVRRPDGKTHFVRVRRVSASAVVPVAGQGSHQTAALAAADGLAIVADGDGLPAGAAVDVIDLAREPFSPERAP